ncbi:unnamed protein product [Nezara viridula]|uniref:Peptidase S1 domain-containing protein n=1 Tax=Nezara viridula TaxID=85310 RepID=A0A9P0HCK0_NEZVI|nr:unnamed protein product [Nezara viridula]
MLRYNEAGGDGRFFLEGHCRVAGFGLAMWERRGALLHQHHSLPGYGCHRKSWLGGSAICFVTEKEPTSPCSGDSGSPLVCGDRQVGIASQMYSSERCDLFFLSEVPRSGCGLEGSVSVYTYIRPVLNCMRKYLGTIIPKKPSHC